MLTWGEVSIGPDGVGGFVCANFVFGGSGRGAVLGACLAEALELDEVAERARVGALESVTGGKEIKRNSCFSSNLDQREI